MLSICPFGSKIELQLFLIESRKYINKEQDINLLSNIFKLTFFLKLIVDKGDVDNQKENIDAMIYDILNSIVSIFELRERYLHLNIRSLIENMARIALKKTNNGNEFDGFIRRKDFDSLKKEKKSENWKYIHETYSSACNYVHLSPKSGMNINVTFMDLLSNDFVTKQSKLISNFQKILSEVIKIFIIYYNDTISNVFYRNKSELKYILGNSLYKEYEKII